MATYNETLTQDGYIAPSLSFSSLICDGAIADQIVDDFGVWVKMRVVTGTSYNEYGDREEDYTDTWIKAYIHQWQATDDEVKEGIFKNGQIMFVFKAEDETEAVTGNRIFYENEWYKITTIIPQIMAGRKYLINAIVKKLQ